MIFTPRSDARWYGFAPAKAGRNEWWMLMIGTPSAQELAREDLHVAGEHDQVDVRAAARSSAPRARLARVTGTWW